MRGSWVKTWRRARVSALPVMVTLALTLPGLFGGRWAVDMGWYGGISRCIVERGDFWFLHAGDRVFFNKPPLAFWAHAPFLWLLGGHDWVVRLPGVLAVCGCVLATVAIVRRLHGPRVAMAAGIVLGATPEIVRVSTQFRLDVPHTLFILLAMLGVVVAGKRERMLGARASPAIPMMASGAMIGLALLTKPFFAPAAYVFMAPWLAWYGARRTLLWMLPSLLIAAMVAAPWHVSMAARYGTPFIDEYLGRQAIGRAMGSTFESDPWWWYLRLIAATYWPWAIPLVMSLVALARGRSLSRHGAGAALAVIWVAAWLIAVSIFADKRRQYLLPAYPGMAWLAALWLTSRPWARASGRGRWRLDAVAGVALTVSALVCVTGASSLWRRPAQDWPEFFEFMRRAEVTELWAGAVHYNNAGMICAITGVWPRTIDWAEDYRTPPPVGALVLYSEAPPPRGAEEVFRSGKVAVVRWPRGLEDPRDRDRPPEGANPRIVR